MNISELIKELEELKEEHGDLEVRVWADHGQLCMDAYSVGIQWVDDEGETYAGCSNEKKKAEQQPR